MSYLKVQHNLGSYYGERTLPAIHNPDFLEKLQNLLSRDAKQKTECSVSTFFTKLNSSLRADPSQIIEIVKREHSSMEEHIDFLDNIFLDKLIVSREQTRLVKHGKREVKETYHETGTLGELMEMTVEELYNSLFISHLSSEEFKIVNRDPQEPYSDANVINAVVYSLSYKYFRNDAETNTYNGIFNIVDISVLSKDGEEGHYVLLAESSYLKNFLEILEERKKFLTRVSGINNITFKTSKFTEASRRQPQKQIDVISHNLIVLGESDKETGSSYVEVWEPFLDRQSFNMGTELYCSANLDYLNSRPKIARKFLTNYGLKYSCWSSYDAFNRTRKQFQAKIAEDRDKIVLLRSGYEAEKLYVDMLLDGINLVVSSKTPVPKKLFKRT